jgi:CheY-like chemotaxis protein
LIHAAVGTVNVPQKAVVVPSAEEAMLEAARHSFDLAVIDVRLPGFSGLELPSRLRKRNKDIHIIQITALTDPKVEEQALAAGAERFFHKPLVMADFLAAVSEILGAPGPASGETIHAPGAEALAGWLAGLRLPLGAKYALLVGSAGQVLARDGDKSTPEPDADLVRAAVAAAASEMKVAGALSELRQPFVSAYQGPQNDLLTAHAGGGVLLLVLPRGRSALRLAIAFETVLASLGEMEKLLAGGTGMLVNQAVARARTEPLKQAEQVKVETAPPEQPAVDDEKLAADMEALFQAGGDRPDTGDLNAFWDAAATDESAGRVDLPDTIDYEQARRMGLAPDDDSN